MVRLGAASLILSQLLHWFVHPAAAGWQDLTDLGFGTLIGIACACFLLSVRSGSRPCLPNGE
jgi:hypothetical protein